MKILLAAVNAKYIHSNLAVHSLAAYARHKLSCETRPSEMPQIEIAEYTINQPISKILTDIYMRKPDLLFFSCYIWNRKEIEELVLDMGKVRPDLDIWLGGPEVSFDAREILDLLPEAKGVLRGEGEEIFYRIVKAYAENCSRQRGEGFCPEDALKEINGVDFRQNDGTVVSTGESLPLDLSIVPFPYDGDGFEYFDHKIVYYESSRGCPFRCSYCLSSIEKSMRFRSKELVKRELEFFLGNDVPQVKFIDRTFNCSHEHAMSIWSFLKEHDNGITNFHFEIAGDLLNEDELELLSSLRPGQIQLEIGVQSTNEKTLREINRPMDFHKLSKVVSAIKKGGNIHLHLDLIAGLPFEDYDSFKRSFNDVFSLRPEQLQLGFLKVLKGSPMEARSSGYGLKYTAFPPYEVLETKWISYDELIKLKAVEEMVEAYYNSGQFTNSIELLLGFFEDSFSFFEEIACWYERHGLAMLNFSRNQRYEKLLSFGMEKVGEEAAEALREAVIFDYYLRENVKTRPEFLGEDRVEKAFAKEFYSREAREHRVLSGGKCDTDDPRLLRRLTHLEKLGERYFLFDYTRRDPMNNNAGVVEIEYGDYSV